MAVHCHKPKKQLRINEIRNPLEREPMQKPLVLGEPIFVGRKTELDDLQKHLDSMLEGKGSTVLVSGVAGRGKTRLVNEFLNIAQDKNVSILLGWCLSSSNVPYFPFVEAFNSYLSPDQENAANGNLSYTVSKMASYLTERSPEQNDEPTYEPTLLWKDRTFLTVTRELLFLSASKPLVLIPRRPTLGRHRILSPFSLYVPSLGLRANNDSRNIQKRRIN